MDSCNNCIHGRPIVSENGISYKCALSPSRATKCLRGEQKFYKSCVADTEDFKHVQQNSLFELFS